MDCMRCGSAMTVASTDKVVLTGDQPLHIVGVPVQRCPACHWEYSDPATAKQIDALRDSGEWDAVESMRVLWFDRAVGMQHKGVVRSSSRVGRFPHVQLDAATIALNGLLMQTTDTPTIIGGSSADTRKWTESNV